MLLATEQHPSSTFLESDVLLKTAGAKNEKNPLANGPKLPDPVQLKNAISVAYPSGYRMQTVNLSSFTLQAFESLSHNYRYTQRL
jgi:hypothetical protein